jgi:hypothetical protein
VTWLDAQADGIALMLVMGVIGIAALLVAGCIEVWRARGMRRRLRQREALRRYCDTIIGACWKGPEGER